MSAPGPHILVVDDDTRLRALIARFLREHDFLVSTAESAAHARTLLGLFAFDLLVLDVMMPDENGLELARSLSVAPPILMLSARSEVEDRLAGLEVGVDDYLTKPFEPRELVLRIRAILRRGAAPEQHRQVRFGDFVFELESGQLLLQGAPVHLTSAESALLKLLAETPGKPVPREELARRLGLEEGSGRGVDVQITRLRKKIEPAEGRPHHIQTIRGAGYQLQGSGA